MVSNDIHSFIWMSLLGHALNTMLGYQRGRLYWIGLTFPSVLETQIHRQTKTAALLIDREHNLSIMISPLIWIKGYFANEYILLCWLCVFWYTVRGHNDVYVIGYEHGCFVFGCIVLSLSVIIWLMWSFPIFLSIYRSTGIRKNVWFPRCPWNNIAGCRYD